jgi:hypothetical protein
MAFAVSEFKSNLKQGGARPSLFKVDFTYPSGTTTPPTRSEFLVKAATIPASTIGSYDVFYHGKAIHVAGDRSFDTWDTTIINDEDFGIRHTLENWMSIISSHKLNTRNKQAFADMSEGDVAKYKSTLKVRQFSKAGEELRNYEFIGAWPSSLSTINLDWGTQEIEEFTCTWMYDSWHSVATGGGSTSQSISNVQGITGTTTGF